MTREEIGRFSAVSVAEHARQVTRLMYERDELVRQLAEMKADRDRLAALVIDLSMQDESKKIQVQSAT